MAGISVAAMASFGEAAIFVVVVEVSLAGVVLDGFLMNPDLILFCRQVVVSQHSL